MTSDPILDSGDEAIYTLRTKGPGPGGVLPFTETQLRSQPSGHLFGWTQNVGMGWAADKVGGGDYLILSTQGGIRQEDGSPVALGYHTGHFEVGLLMEEAANVISSLGGVPFAGFCSDPCDGRTQGTDGMMDSLPSGMIPPPSSADSSAPCPPARASSAWPPVTRACPP
jgi:xylonate dehydratase